MHPGTDRRPFRADRHALRPAWATGGPTEGVARGDGGSARSATGARSKIRHCRREILSPTCRPDDPNSADFTGSHPTPTDRYRKTRSSRDCCASRRDAWCCSSWSLEFQIPVTHPVLLPGAFSSAPRRSAVVKQGAPARSYGARSAPLGHLRSGRSVAAATPAETAAAATASGSEQ
jgi:hypothetical protein